MATDLSEREEEILLSLRKQGAFKGTHVPLWETGSPVWQEYKDAAQMLRQEGLIRIIRPSDTPGRLHGDLTPAGTSKADKILSAARWDSRIKNITRSDWIALAALIVSVIAIFRPNN